MSGKGPGESKEGESRNAGGKGGIATTSPWKGFLFSCIACCVAESITIPVDVVKTRLQLQGELGKQRAYKGSFHAAVTMARTEGVRSLFKGITPALLRQATYGTLRYGSYEPIKQALGKGADGEFPLWKKVLAGTICGAGSSALCNPTDLVKVRMQAAVTGDSSSRTYRSTYHAFRSIVAEEGVVGLYRGVGPTCGRATVGAAVELALYDEFKGTLISTGVVGDHAGAHFAASLGAGFFSCFANSPFDVVKSRVMNQPVDARGRGTLYTGMLDCFAKSVRSEGVTALWKGFWPNYARVGPRVITIFTVLEQLRARFD